MASDPEPMSEDVGRAGELAGSLGGGGGGIFVKRVPSAG